MPEVYQGSGGRARHRGAEQALREITRVQTRAYRHTFIASGLVTKNFLATCDQLAPGASEKMREMARTLTA